MPSQAEGELSIRVAGEADIPALLELMSAALGAGKIPRTREFFAWKHQQNPFGHSPMWLAEVGERCVGLRIFMPWHWHWGNANVAAAVRAVDTATHPEFQGRGIFKKLTLALVEQVKRDGVAFIFNTPNEKSRPGYLKMGWTSLGKASLWLRPELSRSVLGRIGVRLGLPGLSEPDSPEPSDTTALVAALVEAERGGLVERPGSSGATNYYRTLKDGLYLRWRYAACPAATYQAASADPRSALAIYRVRERHGLRELSISELFFERSWSGVKGAVQALALARKAARADYAIIAFEHDRLQGLALSAAGFLPIPGAGPIVTTRPLNASAAAPDPLALRSFKASIGDLELF
jgi:GNAT superfamily N-acetyltransferase